jgi:hypothetical protein
MKHKRLKISAYFASDISLKLLLCLYVLISLGLLIYWTSNSTIIVGNNDGYITGFESFLKNGWYVETSTGTTSVYYLTISFVYQLTNSVSLSFFIVNLLSQVILVVLGVFILIKLKPKKWSLLYRSIFLLYVMRTLILESYNKASNDTFMGVFVLIILYLLIVKVYKESIISQYVLMFIGVFLAFAFGVRPTAVLLIPLILITFWLWKVRYQISYSKLIANVAVLFITFSVVTSLIHFPSLIENSKLSFYDKSNNGQSNWMQKNFLALKSLEANNQPFTNDNVWKTTFEEVKQYVQENGADSLPTNLMKAIQKKPVLYLKVYFYNTLKTLEWLFRFSGFLILLPLISAFSKKKNKEYNVPAILFVGFSMVLFSLLFSVVELRWYLGYEILSYLAIGHSLKNIELNKKPLLNAIFIFSVGLVALFNLRSLINLL